MKKSLRVLLASLALTAACAQTPPAPTPATSMFGPVKGSYTPDEQAFRERAIAYARWIAAEDPQAVMDWAERINLGDPHKYAMPPIVARMWVGGPDDASAIAAYRRLMVIDAKKSDRGLYHFAAYFRCRMYATWKDKLPKDIVESNEKDVREMFRQLRAGGTENHTFMHRATGLVWTSLLPDLFKAGGPLAADKAELEKWLEREIRKFYTAGQGEYDSSTYVAFSMASLANLYDFSTNPRHKELAKAGLDWLMTAQAIKNFHGCNSGPEARGFAGSSVSTITDWANWVSFGDTPVPLDLKGATRPGEVRKPEKHASVVLCMSGYRPHPIIRDIARKNVALPVEMRGSKPSYYGAEPNKDQEMIFVNRQTSMSTLYSPETGVEKTGTILPQTTMFKACMLDTQDVRTFGIANPYHGHFPVEGRTPYDQYHQVKDAAINIANVWKAEDDVTRHMSVLAVPLGIAEPAVEGGWLFWQVGGGYIACRPHNGIARFEELSSTDKTGKVISRASKSHRWLVSPGKLTGWAVQMGEQPDYADLAAFRKAVLTRCQVDVSGLEKDLTVTMVSLRGDKLTLKNTTSPTTPGGKPQAWTNGKEVAFKDWPVFMSPLAQEEVGSGILRISNGARKLTIDVNGREVRWKEEAGALP